jgi:hypothetical protein
MIHTLRPRALVLARARAPYAVRPRRDRVRRSRVHACPARPNPQSVARRIRRSERESDTREHGSPGLRPQHLTQPRDRDLKCLASCCRRGLTPERVDNPLGGDDLIGVQEKQPNQHFLLVPAQPQWSTLAADIERTENPKIHGVPSPTSHETNTALHPATGASQRSNSRVVRRDYQIVSALKPSTATLYMSPARVKGVIVTTTGGSAFFLRSTMRKWAIKRARLRSFIRLGSSPSEGRIR